MGLDLKFLPIDSEYQSVAGQGGHAHSMLEFGRNYKAFELIEKVPQRERPDFDFSSFVSVVPDGTMEGGSCYGRVKETPYGRPLTFARAGELADVLQRDGLNFSPRQKAAVAYLACLPRESEIGLYWH